MILRSHKLREDQIEFLKALPGNDSEHIRAALDEYIEKKKRETRNASASLSLRKEAVNG